MFLQHLGLRLGCSTVPLRNVVIMMSWWRSHCQHWGKNTRPLTSPLCDTQDLQHAWDLLFLVLRVYLSFSVCVCVYLLWVSDVQCPMLSELVLPQQCVSAESLQLSSTQLAIRIWPYLWPSHSALIVSIAHSPLFLESSLTFCSWKGLYCQFDGDG